MVYRNTFTQNVLISFEKSRRIKYNANDLSLFDDTGKPKEYGQDYSVRPKQLPGQERPNHKYIERKHDPKNPGRYIYIYEKPDGTRYEEQEPEPVQEHRKFSVSDLREMAKKNPPEPSLFDHPDDTAKKPFIHQPEGLFSAEMAQEYAERNKHLIGDGFTYQALHDPEITNDRYEFISGLIHALAQTGNETAIPYEEMQKKVSQYDLKTLDPEGRVIIALEPKRYMPVAGPLILKQLNELQIEYDKQHPAPTAKLIAEPEQPAEKKDINTQVQELLDAKQKNKTFRDLNERVTGSRKEAAALKKLQAEEILKLDNATQYERINKKLVMPEYDPHAAKEAGANAGVVYLNMKFRDAVTTKPVNDPTARQIYVKFMPALMEELENAPDLSDLTTVLGKYFVRGWTDHGRKMKVELLFQDNILDKFKELGIAVPVDNPRDLMVTPGDVFGKVFCGLAGKLTDSAVDHWKYAKEIKGVTQQDIDIRKENLYLQEKSFWEKQVAKSDSTIDSLYWHKEERLHHELLKYKVLGEESISRSRNSLKVKTDFFSRPERERDELVTILKERRKADLLEKSRDEAKLRETALEHLNNLRIEVSPQDWSFLPEKTPEIEGLPAEETKIDRKKVGDAIKQFPKLKKVIRTNGREVTDAEVTVENLHDLFGYKSVQLGNWVKDNEAREHIKHFIASMKDLEDVLGIDLKKLNETGGLSIAFGARGKSKALAHYEPMRKIINITKTKGDGSIAHEWGHFFDHYLGGAIEDKLQDQGFATAGVAPETEIQAVVKELVREITTGTAMKTVTFEPPIKTPKKQYRVFNYIMNNNQFSDEQREVKLIEEAKRLIRNNPDKEREIGVLAAYALKKPLTMEYEGLNEYYENSLDTKNPRYWANNQELFARAWEAYIEDKLGEAGIFNNYLVHGNKKGGDGEREGMHRVYPQGEFRGRLNKIFDRLIETTKVVYGVEKTRDTETKRINEVIDYSGNEGDENLFNKSIITISEAGRKSVNRKLTYMLTKLLKRGRGPLKFPVSNLFNSVKTESRQKPSPAEIKKEADEHPGTFKKIQEQQIKTPADLGQAIAEDHAKAEGNKSQEKEAKEYPVYGEIDFQGLTIVVENKPGTVRSGYDPDGEQWKTKMFYPYGYIKGTKATDGEGVDVYVGKNRDSQKVFIVHQKDIATKKYDEDKVMLGFDTKESARDAYLAHYDSYQFLGEITEMSLDEFREKLKTRKGKIIKSESFFGRLLKAVKKVTGTPDWQLEFDFEPKKDEPRQGATNERGETLLPSKSNPEVNRWQKNQFSSPDNEPGKKEPQAGGEPFEMTFEQYAAEKWTPEEEQKMKEHIEKLKKELQWIEEGKIKPSSIIGTGYKNPKPLAISSLTDQISQNETALKNKYTDITLHNYRHRVTQALRAGKQIPEAVQESYNSVVSKLRSRYSNDWGVFASEKYEDFSALRQRIESEG